MLAMNTADFRQWENVVGSGKYAENKPRLSNVQTVQFRKNLNFLEGKS